MLSCQHIIFSPSGTSHSLWTCWTTAASRRMTDSRWPVVRGACRDAWHLCATALCWPCPICSTPTWTVASCTLSVSLSSQSTEGKEDTALSPLHHCSLCIQGLCLFRCLGVNNCLTNINPPDDLEPRNWWLKCFITSSPTLLTSSVFIAAIKQWCPEEHFKY